MLSEGLFYARNGFLIIFLDSFRDAYKRYYMICACASGW